MNMLRAQRPRYRGSIAGRHKKFFSLPQRRDLPRSLVTDEGGGADGNKQDHCMRDDLSGFVSQQGQHRQVLTASGAHPVLLEEIVLDVKPTLYE
jgi:hypothetical protein